MSNIKKGDWILLTGASGFLGAHVLDAILENGYRAKCTVRSESKADELKKLRPQHINDMSFVIIPDMNVPGAFDEAVKGVTGVLHTASPYIESDDQDFKNDLLEPAINGTINMLAAVTAHNPSITRVVITSSAVAHLDLLKGLRAGYAYTENDWNNATYDWGLNCGNGLYAYIASKSLAEKAAWNYVKEHKTNFSLVTLSPPYIYGPLRHPIKSVDVLNTSTAHLYNLFNGSQTSIPHTPLPAYVDVRDLSLAHIRGLTSPAAAKGVEQRYLVVGGDFTYIDVVKIIRERFPELYKSRTVPNPDAASYPDHYTLDSSKSVKELGMEYRTLEETVVDTVNDLLRLERLS